ncbi:galactokinase [Eubacterium pyruvativorans]|uniref:galactokinase n=1 Tax=Eubacterium pyruvativorans TaxID=155865 RepID=UPI003F8C3871
MNRSELESAVKTEAFRRKLEDVYGPAGAEEQTARYQDVVKRFSERFGNREDMGLFSAPGRTEIGGNHTDHQWGKVLAAAVDADMIAAAAPNGSDRVRIYSRGYGEFVVSLNETDRKAGETGRTEALVRGVLKGAADRGYRAGGFDAYVSGDVPGGSGLSSSAAFEILTGLMVSQLFNRGEISPAELAKIGQFAENVYFGKPCGLMDQLACAVGGLCGFDFFDPEEPEIHRVQTDPGEMPYAVAITATGGSHADLTEDFAAVPREMKQVADFFGEPVLRDIVMGDLLNEAREIREKCGDRAFLRAMHFVGETARAEEEVQALEAGDYPRFLDLVRESGDSSWKYLQNVSTGRDPADQPVAVALAVSDQILGSQGVSRVHGGGFAGTIQAFVRREMADKYRETMDQILGPGSCRIFRIRKYGCLRML